MEGLNFEKFEEYDRIVATIVSNLIVENDRVGEIVLFKFDPKQYSHKLYYYVAVTFVGPTLEKIYIDLPLYKYVFFLFKNWKARKIIQRLTDNIYQDINFDKLTSTTTLMNFIMNYHKIDESVCKDIVESYYEDSRN